MYSSFLGAGWPPGSKFADIVVAPTAYRGAVRSRGGRHIQAIGGIAVRILLIGPHRRQVRVSGQASIVNGIIRRPRCDVCLVGRIAATVRE